VHGRKQFVALPFAWLDAVQAGLDLQRFARGEEGIEDDFLRNDADCALCVAGVLIDVESPDRSLAAALNDQPRKDVD